MDKSGYIEYGTSLAFEIPKNHVGLLFPRSSISKIKMILTNSVGVIDSSYRGEVKLRFKPANASVIRWCDWSQERYGAYW